MSGGASLFNKIDDVLLSKLESGQWRERGDTLDQIAKHLEIPVLPSGNYGPLIKALLQVVEADKNRQLVLRAVGILQQLAQGLRKSFVPHAERTLSVCLNRCKENNQGIVQALRSASQTVVDLMSLEPAVTVLMNGLSNPSPSVQATCADVLTHALVTRSSPLNEFESIVSTQRPRHVKPLLAPLRTLSQHRSVECREASFQAFAAVRLFLDSNPGQFTSLTEGHLDGQRCLKVELAYDLLKTDMQKRISTAEQKPQQNATDRTGNKKRSRDSSSSSGDEGEFLPPSLLFLLYGIVFTLVCTDPPPVSWFHTVAVQPPAAGTRRKQKQKDALFPTPMRTESKQTKTARPAKQKQKQRQESNPPGTEDYQTLEQARDGLANYFAGMSLEQLTDTNWKLRLAATEVVKTKFDSDPPSGETAIRLLYFFVHSNRLNDINLQVRNVSLEIVSHVLKRLQMLGQVLSDRLFHLICDATIPNLNKSRKLAQEILDLLFRMTSTDVVLAQMLPILFGITVPTVLATSLEWMASVVTRARFRIDDILPLIKHGLASANPGVRNAAVHLAGKFYVSLGPDGGRLRTLFSDEKPVMLARLQTEFTRCEAEADNDTTSSDTSERNRCSQSEPKKLSINTTFAAVAGPGPQTNVRESVSSSPTNEDDSIGGTPIRGVINPVARQEQPVNTQTLFLVRPGQMDTLLEMKQTRLTNLTKMTCIDLGNLHALFVAANANSQLVGCMFAPDVDSRLEALDRLITNLDHSSHEPSDPSALLLTYVYFDLFLAWTVGGCFAFGSSSELQPGCGTPAVSDLEALITRGLHYLTAAIVRFAQANFKLSNQEASLLLHALLSEQSPSLRCTRLHRSIESQLSNAISDLIRLLRQVHPASLLMDHIAALLHKCSSVSERQNCLQELTSLVPRYGDVQKSIGNLGFTSKLVAQQIANSNPGVRRAALDFLLLVHGLLGNNLWEQIGPLQPNDKKLLEQHLKVQVGTIEMIPPCTTDAPFVGMNTALLESEAIPPDSVKKTCSRRIPSPPPAHVSPAALGILIPLLRDRDGVGTTEMTKLAASKKLDCALGSLIGQLELTDYPDPPEQSKAHSGDDQDDTRVLSSVILGALVDLETIVVDPRTCDLLIPYMNSIIRRLAILLRTLARTTCISAMHAVFTNSLAGALVVLFKQPFLTREVNVDSLVYLLAGLFQLAESSQLEHDKPGYCNPRRAVLLRLVYFILKVVDPTTACSALLRLLSMCCFQSDCCRVASSTAPSRRTSTRRSSTAGQSDVELLIKDLSSWPRIWRLVVAQLWQRIDSLDEDATRVDYETLAPLLSRIFTSVMDSSSDKTEKARSRRKSHPPPSGLPRYVQRCVLHLLVTLYAYAGPKFLELVKNSEAKNSGRLVSFLMELGELMPNAPYPPGLSGVVRRMLQLPDISPDSQKHNVQ
ncbi:HEAT repeat protein [Opisthorchis viverrini]|uniref:HEAT repeat protein n=1 Tax=Opisthorchis viverrini TaxID=6198 RepID=A0A1S8X340_OPIVI|nr:HEAT repeat protein [Opisthorchis viverrini]